MTDAVTVPVMIEVATRKMSCQWARITFILMCPATSGSKLVGTVTPGIVLKLVGEGLVSGD